MSETETEGHGPDFGQGVELATLRDGAMMLGHVGDEPILLARRGEELFAIGAFCTHYGAPLDQGLVVGETVRCPWHHACFSLRTGQVLRAPALDPISRWRVEIVFDPVRQLTSGEQWAGVAYVREKMIDTPRRPRSIPANEPDSAIIVGGGAAGNAAAETLRQEGYSGRITMLSADASMPCDRPNLSKQRRRSPISSDRPNSTTTMKSMCDSVRAWSRSTLRAGNWRWRMEAG
jgi:nitrite reductase/ring-hydroxylating ferredoxin subunit